MEEKMLGQVQQRTFVESSGISGSWRCDGSVYYVFWDDASTEVYLGEPRDSSFESMMCIGKASSKSDAMRLADVFVQN